MLLLTDVNGNFELSNSDNNDKMVQKLSSNKKLIIRAADYLNFNAKIAFISLKKTFIKAPIFCHFDLKYYIWIKLMLPVMPFIKF